MVQAKLSTPASYQEKVAKYEKLSNFYNSIQVARASWDVKKALKGEYSRASSQLLKMVGGGMHKKLSLEEVPKSPIIILGDGDFSAVNSKHTTFAAFFVRLVRYFFLPIIHYWVFRSLGYRVFQIDEYLTSQMCPCCAKKVETHSMRAKYCRPCKKIFHRDVMAAENMCVAAKAIAETGERPKFLMKKPPDSTEHVGRKRPASSPSSSKAKKSRDWKSCIFYSKGTFSNFSNVA